ncbi:MAG: Coenzyme F420 hydrogenase/dehydrogenase, beta subunit C-terminal domain [Candidatus Muirbacterium halophilum]|nr:Coenzyme F420 hydrogenase/dehydrogenase, beta subunit C-terminal domain [Candidatus Muirbacterium halophilum]MCK9474612.1 Coenzyme F420 hydrogenase/dehydrogenase, beta subunit C-terminal domain [Candidatus Muirbacterium halophilum]
MNVYYNTYKNSNCIFCGACANVCSNVVVDLCGFNQKLKILNMDICKKCVNKRCLKVCPNSKFEVLNKKEYVGNIKSIYYSFSKNQIVNLGRSSGGFIYEFSKYIMENNIIDGIISIRHVNALDYETHLYNDIDDLKRMPTSVYHTIDFSGALKILKNNCEKKFMIIGLPCHIKSIVNTLKLTEYKYLEDRVKIFLGIICGYTFNRNNLKIVFDKNKIRLSDIKEIKYRGNGNGRINEIRFKNKEKFVVSREKKFFNSFFSDQCLVNNSCLYCNNHLGRECDIVVGDGWDNKENINGVNLIIIRKSEFEDMIKDNGSLFFKKAQFSNIIRSQSKKYALGNLSRSLLKNKIDRKIIKFNDWYVMKIIPKLLFNGNIFLSEILFVFFKVGFFIKKILNKIIIR